MCVCVCVSLQKKKKKKNVLARLTEYKKYLRFHFYINLFHVVYYFIRLNN